MMRSDSNRLGEMEVFVKVVERGSFSAGARALRMTPSAVSKLVARIENRLAARLFNRSTRKLLLTAEGSAFYQRCIRILADIDEAERETLLAGGCASMQMYPSAFTVSCRLCQDFLSAIRE
jgi:DNA-binding transcriptional LysR family regulator